MIQCTNYKRLLAARMLWRTQNFLYSYLVLFVVIDSSLQLTPIRLVGGKNDNEGRVEVYHNGKWGTVCGKDFDADDAKVVCRMIGKENSFPVVFPRAHFGTGNDPIWMDGINCRGHEADIGRCEFKGWGKHVCGHGDDAGVNCDTKVRLMNGSNPTEGRVEIYHNGTWGTICDKTFDTNDAQVICSMLGFKNPHTSIYPEAKYGEGEGPVWMENLQCNGTEKDATNCSFSGWGVGSCKHQKDVGLACATPVRLLGGRTPSEGRIEVFHNGQWGSICDDYFNLDDAKVVCKTLGFQTVHPEVFKRAHFQGHPDGIFMDDLHCNGIETDIGNCKFRGWGVASGCTHAEDAGVSCGPPVRLVSGRSPSKGRLEIFHNNEWGTICKQGFGEKEATVACRMLGYTNQSPKVYEISSFGRGRGMIWMDGLNCIGNERSLESCSFDGWGSYSCNHNDVVAIDCGTPIRLAATGIPGEGRLEIHRFGKWGTICTDNFDTNAAKVACRMLGFESVSPTVFTNQEFGEGSLSSVIKGITCTGEESDIQHCYLHDINGQCTGEHAVGVSCGTAVRLVNGGLESSGRVEIFHVGLWGTICDDSFDERDAKVVCRMLGYSDTNPSVYGNAYFGQGTGTIWMDGMNCTGYESDITKCSFKGWGKHKCGHNEDVGISCVTDVRLVDGETAAQGRVEVLHNGTWGTICNNNFGTEEAQVICRMLGYYTPFPEVFKHTEYGEGNETALMDHVRCQGNEMDIATCDFTGWGSSNCDHSRDVGISCATKLRLKGGRSPSEGSVEVFYKGQWGTICPDSVGAREGRVLCRMLGYDDSHPRVYKDSHFEKLNSSFMMDFLQCDGTEPDIAFCMITNWNVVSCNTQNTLGIRCNSPVRLVDGTKPSTGRLEVYHNERWGTICDAGFGVEESKVVCHSLGYNLDHPEIFKGLYKQNENLPTWIGNLTCIGDEQDISSCAFMDWGNSSCTHEDDVGVSCETEVRLVGGRNPWEGRVEIRHQNAWGTVCDFEFDETAATIVCNMLGYYNPNPRIFTGAFFGKGNETVLMTNTKCTGMETDIADCSFDGWGSGSCAHSNDVGVSCVTNLRLQDGENPSEGRLELYYNGKWGTVCNTTFSLSEAQVICRMLGYDIEQTEILPGSYYGEGKGTIWMDNVKCTGTEPDIALCSFPGWAITECDHNHDVGISCGVHVRLAGGDHRAEGRVEVFHDGQWGAVCDNSFDERDAEVVCRMLGFQTYAVAYQGAYFGEGDIPFLLDNLDCNGNETHLSFCKFGAWGQHSCQHGQEAGVTCGTRIRLVNGSEPSEGRIEVYHEGQWGTICSEDFDVNDARVICRSLGYNIMYAFVYKNAHFGNGTGPVFLSELGCNGDETDVGFCKLTGWNNNTCSHSQDVGISCVTLVRLTDGPKPSEGRVEIYHNGWGTVCDDEFDTPDGAVICTMLGYNNTNPVIYTSSHYGQGAGTIHLDNLNCNGDEIDVADCTFPGWGESNCNHREDVGLDCSTKVRLVDGSGPNEGRFEVYHDGKWGTVCSKKFEEKDGKVLCKMLGYKNPNVTIFATPVFGEGSGPNWMSNIDCAGTETDIALCKFSGWGKSNCTHDMDVSLSCGPTLQIRLADGVFPSEGRVEVYNSSKWGTVCMDGFTRNDAIVFCRMLGFNVSNSDPEIVNDNTFGEGSGLVALENIQCGGAELDIAACNIQGWGITKCSHAKDVGIRCPRTEIRLVGGNKPSEGRLEVYHEGDWGSVCSQGFSENDTKVICRMLGFSSEGSTYYAENKYGRTNGPSILKQMSCKGSEIDIFNCKTFKWTDNACSHDQDVAISCTPTPMRLAGGAGIWEGRIEVFHEGEWGTVCDTKFGEEEATVICNMLGFKESEVHAQSFGGSFFGTSTKNILLDKLTCTGEEVDISICKTQDWGVHNCTNENEASVRCQSNAIRLVDGAHNMEGRVEILANGTWYTVCDKEWDDVDAQVVCRMLTGYPFDRQVTGKAFPGGYFGKGSGSILLSNTKCNGSEIDILHCQADVHNTGNCEHSNDAGVLCTIGDNMKLVKPNHSGTETSGTVEILFNGQWNSLCGESLNRTEAIVLCRSMGVWSSSPKIYPDAWFGQGDGSALMIKQECKGSEINLAFCESKSIWGKQTCQHSNDVGVNCVATPLGKFSLRTVDGLHPGQGRMEVFYNGKWGTFCYHHWHLSNNAVVCKMLGYRTVKPVSFEVDNGQSPMLIGTLNCKGDETDIGMCTADLDKTACDKSAVEIDCTDGIRARLMDGNSPADGRVEISKNGVWGSVCVDEFDVKDAKVICRMLGFRDTSPTVINYGRDLLSNGIAISHLDCEGWEEHISQCSSYANGGTCGVNVAHIKCLGCYHEYYTATGNITSPNFPFNYPPNVDCIYVLNLPQSQAPYKLQISSLTLANAGDYLEIRELQEKTLLGTFNSGSNLPILVGKSFTVRFKTDNVKFERGFQLEWSPLQLSDAVTVHCGHSRWNIEVNVTILREIYASVDVSQIFLSSVCSGSIYDDLVVFSPPYTDCNTSKSEVNGSIFYIGDISYLHDKYVLWSSPVVCKLSQRNRISFTLGTDKMLRLNSNLAFIDKINFDDNMQFEVRQSTHDRLHGSNSTIYHTLLKSRIEDADLKMVLQTCHFLENGSLSNLTIVDNRCPGDSSVTFISTTNHEIQFDFVLPDDGKGTIECVAKYCLINNVSPDCQQCNM